MTRDGRDRDVRASATGRDVGATPVFAPGPIAWGSGQWREDAYPLVPARPRTTAERDAGDRLDWYAAIRSWAADGRTLQSWEYAVFGRKAFTFVEAAREIGSPAWSGSYLVAPAAAGSLEELVSHGSPPSTSASGGAPSASSGAQFDEAFSEEVGHLPTDAQSFLLRDYVSGRTPPQRWRTWRIRGERRGHLRDERWYWIVGRRTVSFVGATRQLPGYFAPSREWRGSGEADQLDEAPWQAAGRVIDVSSVPIIRTFTRADEQLR